MFDEGLPNLRPNSFFHLSFDCFFLPSQGWEKAIESKKYQIPDTAFLNSEETFASVHMGWSDDGLSFAVFSRQPPAKSFFPELKKGDSIELWVDTRDVKSAGFTTKFCHHFYFLLELVNGKDRGEITRFRNEDSHELCPDELLLLNHKKTSDGYLLKCFLPSQCLFGFDSKETDRVGFTYRLNRFNGPSQHFSVVTEEFAIEQQPSLWATAKLIK
ncbi:MAG: hypothetical protein ACSNEK_05370 [Parachlamydiaceae bacterium]